MRFRYSTDAAYLDTGWFVDDVPSTAPTATLSPSRTTGSRPTASRTTTGRSRSSPCDLTPGGTSTEGEIVDSGGNYVYRFEGDSIHESGFDTTCLRGTKGSVTAVISNLTSGDIQVLDADYVFRLLGSSGQGRD